MTPKQNKHLSHFIFCAVIVAFFAMVGGCARSCAKDAAESSKKREKMKERKAREVEERRKNPRRYNMYIVNFLNYGY